MVNGKTYMKESIGYLGLNWVFAASTRNDNTRGKDNQNLSKTDYFSRSLVLKFGFLVFPHKKFSVEGSISSVGAGYEKQEFFLDERPDGSSEDLFVLLTPDLFTMQFKVSTDF
jgi:hypothetical protein